MTSAADKKYWFRAKRYGWGWGLPQKWQGWVSFGLFIAVWLGALAFFLPVDDQDMSMQDATAFVTIVVLDAAALVYVSFKHGEPPKWRWGKKEK